MIRALAVDDFSGLRVEVKYDGFWMSFVSNYVLVWRISLTSRRLPSTLDYNIDLCLTLPFFAAHCLVSPQHYIEHFSSCIHHSFMALQWVYGMARGYCLGDRSRSFTSLHWLHYGLVIPQQP